MIVTAADMAAHVNGLLELIGCPLLDPRRFGSVDGGIVCDLTASAYDDGASVVTELALSEGWPIDVIVD